MIKPINIMTINFKSFQDSGQIQDIKAVEHIERLHRLTTDVILYVSNHYVEMLSDGNFLYRPSGKGQGKRSKVLANVERYIYFNLIYGKDRGLN